MNSKELDQFYSTLKEELAKDDDLAMPDESNSLPSVYELLDSTDPRNIYITSDWHFFKNHYKKEANYVNTQKILTWCRQNIKDNDIFMYLGDISFRYANEEDQKESQKLMASIPGIKVLILGNHDIMVGDDYYTGCGFNYVYERLDWKNIVFTHKPISMQIMPEDYLNIHGHMHKWREYNTSDGSRNINVYPFFFDNKPVTLDYCIKHVDELVKDNKRSNWTQMGESAGYDIEDLYINLETSRANLKDNQFGIPEDRKYPLDSEKHVMSAIKLFGHAEESKKKALAKRIKTAAKKYDIKIPETTQVYKYLAEAAVDTIDIPTGVENIIFDMGGVLVDDNGAYTYKAHANIPDEYCDEIYDIIGKELFLAKNNKKLLYCDLAEAKEYIYSILPEHIKPYNDYIFEAIAKGLFKFSYTDDIIDAFRSRGYKVYYLSNWEKCLYDIEREVFDPLIDKFDGGLFSFECHIEKPSLSIYKLFTDKFKLEPDKCLFFDDKKENIDAAKACGWNTVLFDKHTTPLKIFKTLFSTHHVSIPDAEVKNKIPALMQDGLEYINSSKIKFWYVTDVRNPNNIHSNDYYETIDIAVSYDLHDSDFEEDYILYVTKYVFTIGKNNEPVCLGSIIVFRDKSWEWFIQYPFIVDGGGQLKDSTVKQVNEWAMAGMNPVVGITKPYVLKMCNDCGDLINANRYALATDLVADKYLIINENANLEIVDASSISNMVVEQYEFVGDKRLIKKIEEAYYSGKIVDNTFFYTALTGKPMLSEDQIDFDSNFRKVDFIAMKENSLTRLATLNEAIMEAIGAPIMKVDIIPDNNSRLLLGDKSYLSIKKDISGYYIFNKNNYKRSASVEEMNFITEQMINSVL